MTVHKNKTTWRETTYRIIQYTLDGDILDLGEYDTLTEAIGRAKDTSNTEIEKVIQWHPFGYRESQYKIVWSNIH